jgi:hypothetical protein
VHRVPVEEFGYDSGTKLKESSVKKKSLPQESNADVLFDKASESWERGRLRSAFFLFLRAAKDGDPGAQHNLGYFYDVGIGVQKNREQALRWYGKAFQQGSRVAASNIATIFRDENKTKKALSWFERAVRLGDADANLEIAKIYLRGPGDPKKAIPYLKRTMTAKPCDVTRASQLEAEHLLKRLSKIPGRRSRD